MSQSMRVAVAMVSLRIGLPQSICIPLVGGEAGRNAKCAAARQRAQADSCADAPQIRLPAIPCARGIGAEIVRLALEHDAAVAHHIEAAGNLQGDSGLLLDQEDCNAAAYRTREWRHCLFRFTIAAACREYRDERIRAFAREAGMKTTSGLLLA